MPQNAQPPLAEEDARPSLSEEKELGDLEKDNPGDDLEPKEFIEEVEVVDDAAEADPEGA